MKVKSRFKVTQLEGAGLGFEASFLVTLEDKLLLTTFTCSSNFLEPF